MKKNIFRYFHIDIDSTWLFDYSLLDEEITELESEEFPSSDEE